MSKNVTRNHDWQGAVGEIAICARCGELRDFGNDEEPCPVGSDHRRAPRNLSMFRVELRDGPGAKQ